MNASSLTGSSDGDRFNEVLALIHSSRHKAMQAVNTQLIELYWQVGAHISLKIARAEWGIRSLLNWPRIWRKPSRGYEDSPAQICSACASFMKRIEMIQLSHHW